MRKNPTQSDSIDLGGEAKYGYLTSEKSGDQRASNNLNLFDHGVVTEGEDITPTSKYGMMSPTRMGNSSRPIASLSNRSRKN